MNKISARRALRRARWALPPALALGLAACGGGGGGGGGGGVNKPGPGPTPSSYTVGGMVSGLASGQQLTLLDNGSDPLVVKANGPFQFPGPIAAGGAYAVSVGAQPSTQLCAVSNAAGSGVGANVSNVAVACGSHYAYAVDSVAAGAVYQYSLNGDGSLSALNPASVSAGGSYPFDMVADPTGTHLYIAAGIPGSSLNYQYAIYVGTVGANGAVTVSNSVSPNPATDLVDVLAMDSSGNYLFGTAIGVSTIHPIDQFQIGADGVPAPLATPSITPSVSVGGLTTDPRGPYLYAVAPNDNVVAQFKIGSDGSLSEMATPTVKAGTAPYSLTVDPSGKYAYAVNFGTTRVPSDVWQYTIGSSGALSAMNPASVPVADGARRMVIDPRGRYAYVVSGTLTVGAVSQYTIGSNGALTPMTPASVPAGARPRFPRVDPTGSYLYVTNGSSGDISAYKIGPGGLLSPVVGSPFPAGSNPQGLVVH